MTRRVLPPLALLLLAPAARAAPCEEVAEGVRRACAASSPHEQRGSEPFQFNQDLCRAAAEVARRACETGVHGQRYGGSCVREAEYVGDVMAEACRRVLYRNPRPFVKIWFKVYDERCQRHARAAEERALADRCPARPAEPPAQPRPAPR